MKYPDLKIKLRIKKLFKKPITRTIIFAIVMGLIIFLIENQYGVDKNTIILNLTVLFSVFGYFFVHYLEINRKQREERLKHYRELASKIRVFVKEMEDKTKLGEEFDEAYYTSWMAISSKAYKKLIKYLDSYTDWVKAKKENKNNIRELLEKVQENLKEFMKVIREEFVIDEDVEFKDYDIRWVKKEQIEKDLEK